MPPVRSRSPPNPPRSIPRESIPYAALATIDGALKALRLASKRVNATVSSHELELGILVRVHYKNKNQHRGALFWRKVEDVKRFATRLHEMDLPALLDHTRLAFHAPEVAQQAAKKIKSAWTRAPDATSVAFVLERVHSACLLIDASRIRYICAYEFLSRTMAGGAFLSLMLMLSSITSRLSLLLVELRDALQGAWDALNSVYLVAHEFSPAAQPPPLSLPPPPGEGVALAPLESTELAEDTGQALAANSASPVGLAMQVDDVLALLVEPTANEYAVVPAAVQPASSSRVETIVVSRKLKEDGPVKKKKKKKSTARDEIDLIFG